MKQLSYHSRFILVLLFTLLNTLPICSQVATLRYRIAACDWMMLKRQKLGEFKLAHELGADGVEVDMGGLGKRVLFDNQLREPQQAEKFQDAADHHRDICKELRKLGAQRIVQIHASNTDSVNLQEDPEINLPKIRKTLDKMKWSGWLVVERSRDVKRVRDVKYNFGRNIAYLKQVFQER